VSDLFKDAVFTFNSQVDIQVFVFGNHPDQSFRFMGVETIHHDVPSGGFRITIDCPFDVVLSLVRPANVQHVEEKWSPLYFAL
jgi:hypothetical protein